MRLTTTTASIAALTLLFCVADAGPSHAIDTCRAKIDKKSGVILVDATNVGGTLQWGSAAGSENRSMFNAATCVADGKAKKCELADPVSVDAKTPPAGCTVYLDDGVAACSAWIPGCTPGARAAAGVLMKDATGKLIGYVADYLGLGVIHDTGTALVGLAMGSNGTNFTASGIYYFSAPSCAGTVLLPPDTNPVKTGYVRSDSIAYYGPPSGSMQSVNSQLHINPSLNCSFIGGTVVPPNGCCLNSSSSLVLGTAISIDLTAFTAPFVAEVP